MRILLTGFTGRIGPYVLQELSNAGYPIRGLIEPGVDVPTRFYELLEEGMTGDITDPVAWQRAVEGVDAVVHLAAISGETPQAFETNVTSTRLLAQACHAAQVRSIIFASSNCVLGQCDRPGEPPYDLESLPVDEAHPLKPHADYGLSKLVGEHILHAAARRWGLRVLALRPAMILSPEDIESRVWTRFSTDFHVAHLWAYLHVLDAARAFRLALEAELDGGFEPMYINAKDTLSDTPTLRLAEQHYPKLIDDVKGFQGFESLISTERANSLIGFEPRLSWRH
jgi:nucleoside-diphosphate-sugar epimerase